MQPDTPFTRRVCAVLLADVTGFSKLMGEDDERTARAVQHLQSIAQGIVSDSNGHAEPVAGDALFATFESVVAAVQAAVTIQRRLGDDTFEGQPLQIRIGVHVGDVLLRDGRAFGDAINVAARLEALARPGTICISEGVYRQVRNKFDEQFVDLGRQQLKNISDPVHAYLIVPKDAAQRPATRRRSLWLAIGAAAIAVVAIGAMGAWRLSRHTAERASIVEPPAAAPAAVPKSVAVLPFTNMSPDQSDEYLSDGMTEEIITALSKVPALHVAARTSSFAFKGKNEPIETIGAQLHVGAILEGSVAKAGTKLRITAQLINIADGYHLWSDTYDREMQDIFAVRADVAQRVADALEVELGVAVKQQITQKPTDHPEAYQLYLKGRYFTNKLTRDGVTKGADYFRQAIAIDPNYALAHAGLAYYYLSSTEWFVTLEDGRPKAREEAQKALALDDTLAEAHVWLANVHFYWDWDWPAAEREFRRALDLDPSSAFAHQCYGAFLTSMGRSDEGIAEGRRAVELDPLSFPALWYFGLSFYVADRYEQANEQSRRMLEIDPGNALGHYMLAAYYERSGALDQAIAEMRTARRLEPANPDLLGFIGWLYAVTGHKDDARQAIEQLQDRSLVPYTPPADVALIYVGLGERDQAIAWLTKAYDERAGVMPQLRYWKGFDVLRSDPRFVELLKKVGTP